MGVEIIETFEEIFADWLLTGRGEMIRNYSKNIHTGDVSNSQIHQDNRENFNDCVDSLKDQLKVKDDQLKAKDEQISKLMDLLGKQ